MRFDPNKHHRRSIRLQGYDYSQGGAYFITACAERRLCQFGEIDDGIMRCNAAGEMIAQQWLALSERFPNLVLDEWVVMPNHFHGVIVVDESGNQERATTIRVLLGQPSWLPKTPTTKTR